MKPALLQSVSVRLRDTHSLEYGHMLGLQPFTLRTALCYTHHTIFLP